MRVDSAMRAAVIVVACACVELPAYPVSLFDASNFRSLTSDNKAFRVGDAITVQVLENSSATSSADTGTRRENNIGISISAQRNGNTQTGELRGSAGGDFSGGGQTQRLSRLLATLTVTVREVLPNGELRVSGEQLLKVNGEQQRVNLEGRVRPHDISDGNVVLSTRIADARITYAGDGELSERTQRGVVRRLLDWLGL